MAAEDTKASGTEPEDANGTEPGVTDSHGQVGISRGKYERETKAYRERIAALETRLAEREDAAKGKADETARLAKDLDDLKAQLADERTDARLNAAGCVNSKAARALLDDYDGDVARMAEACPYLFRSKQGGTIGGKPSHALLAI